MKEFIKKRLDFVDFSRLPKGERIDKMSSFSKVDDISEEKKSFWEKIYDDALAKISSNSGVGGEELKPVQYYSLKEQPSEEEIFEEQVPIIDVVLPNGGNFKAPAYEHIPIFSTQIELLPNQLMKVYENITVIANGNKVREPLIRIIKKESPSQKNKISLILDEVKINGSVVPYQLVEQGEYYVLRPVQGFKLPEGIYVFEFRYLVDRYLWDYGDFYELYWDLTGSHFNLLVNRAFLAVKLPGREKAVKRFVLSGRGNKLSDKNAVLVEGEDNTFGLMNIYPLRMGESLHTFMTIPKVDFSSVTSKQKFVWFVEDYGDILLAMFYLIVVVGASVLSWRYIQKKLKFKNVSVPTPLLTRILWKGFADKKILGCVLLELFRKNIIDIQESNTDVVLVKKTNHSKNITRFEQKLLSLLFVKNDNICKFNAKDKSDKIWNLIEKEAELQLDKFGIIQSKMYIGFNVLMLLLVEMGLVFWHQNSFIWGLLALVDVLWLVFIGFYFFMKFNKLKKVFILIGATICYFISAIVLHIYLNLAAILMLLIGGSLAAIFIKKASGMNALLKNARQVVKNQRDNLLKQQEHIVGSRTFGLQQANILALDLEEYFSDNVKIKNVYRLDKVDKLLNNFH